MSTATFVVNAHNLQSHVTSRGRLNGLNIGRYITNQVEVRIDPQRHKRRGAELFNLQRQQARVWNQLPALER